MHAGDDDQFTATLCTYPIRNSTESGIRAWFFFFILCFAHRRTPNVFYGKVKLNLYHREIIRVT